METTAKALDAPGAECLAIHQQNGADQAAARTDAFGVSGWDSQSAAAIAEEVGVEARQQMDDRLIGVSPSYGRLGSKRAGWSGI